MANSDYSMILAIYVDVHILYHSLQIANFCIVDHVS